MAGGSPHFPRVKETSGILYKFKKIYLVNYVKHSKIKNVFAKNFCNILFFLLLYSKYDSYLEFSFQSLPK